MTVKRETTKRTKPNAKTNAAILGVCAVFIVSTPAFAVSTKGHVNGYWTESDSLTFYSEVGGPATCQSSPLFQLKKSHPMYREMYEGLILALKEGYWVLYETNGCNTNKHIIQQIKVCSSRQTDC